MLRDRGGRGGSAYVTGQTGSTDFPIQSPYQAMLGGTGNAFVGQAVSAEHQQDACGQLRAGTGGATYTVTVSNTTSAATSGMVTVTETPRRA